MNEEELARLLADPNLTPRERALIQLAATVPGTASTLQAARAVNPTSELAQQAAAINIADPLAQAPGGAGIQRVGQQQQQPAQVFTPPAPAPAPAPVALPSNPLPTTVPPDVLGNQAAVLSLDEIATLQAQAAQQQALGQEVAQIQAAQLQNAIQLDDFNRAQAASNLVLTPQAQFTPQQIIQNAGLTAGGVPSSATGAAQALTNFAPNVGVASTQPAINALANQTRSVNAQEQQAQAARLRAIEEARIQQERVRANFQRYVAQRLSLSRNQ